MAAGAISFSVSMATESLTAALAELEAWLVECPEKAGEVRDLLFCDGKLRPGLVSIVQVPAGGAGDLVLRVDLSDQGRELVRALVAGEIDGAVVQKLRHGSFLSGG
jgi:hypothetical protein